MKQIILITVLSVISGCSNYYFFSDEKDIINFTSELNEHNYKIKREWTKNKKTEECFDLKSERYKNTEQIKYKDFLFECRSDYGGAWVSKTQIQE